MLERLNCILFKRAIRPVYIWTYQYGWMPSARTRVNRHLRPYETSPSPAIQDITVSGHTRHHRLRPYKTSPSPTVHDISASGCSRHHRLRLRPVYAILSPLVIHRRARNKTKWKEWNTVIFITASLKPCESEQDKSTVVVWGWPSIRKQRNPRTQTKGDTTLNRPLLP